MFDNNNGVYKNEKNFLKYHGNLFDLQNTKNDTENKEKIYLFMDYNFV